MSVIAELKAMIGLDATSFKAETKKVESLASSLQKHISGIGGMLAGAFSVGAIIAFGKRLMETANEMDKIAEATNLTMGQLVALKTVAAENGLGMDDLSKVLAKVRDAQGSLVNLSEKHEKALKLLKISADEFVGANTDKALELIANAYVRANGSAEAFAAINELFGGKIGRKTIEMLMALDKEGLGPLAERTKDATAGFEELANAQSKIEKFFNSVQIWAAKAIGAVSKFGEEMGKLSVKKPKQGFLSSTFEAVGNVWYAGKYDQDLGVKTPSATAIGKTGGTLSNIPTVNTDVQKMRENQAAEAKKAADKANKAAQELGRRYYFKELHNQDEADRLNADYADEVAGLYKPGKIKGLGANVDNLMKIGGQIGMSRPGLAREDRQMKILEESKNLQKEFNQKLQELIDKQDRDRERDEG